MTAARDLAMEIVDWAENHDCSFFFGRDGEEALADDPGWRGIVEMASAVLRADLALPSPADSAARDGQWVITEIEGWEPGEPQWTLDGPPDGCPGADFLMLPDAEWWRDYLNALATPAPAPPADALREALIGVARWTTVTGFCWCDRLKDSVDAIHTDRCLDARAALSTSEEGGR